jgi:hypothetical protein
MQFLLFWRKLSCVLYRRWQAHKEIFSGSAPFALDLKQHPIPVSTCFINDS